MLVLGIDYLNGWALATDPTDREQPEWPPHPDRVFMALAAAHFETDGDAAERATLEWLETLGDPSVIISPFDPTRHQRSTVTTYVPVNDDADPIKKGKPLMATASMPIGRDRQARTFPIAVPQDSRVTLVWSEADATAEQCETLNQLCGKVTHVGHSASLVRMWAAESIPHWHQQETPDRDVMRLEPTDMRARFRLRVFGTGRLRTLESLCNLAAIDDYAALSTEATDLKIALRRGAKGAEKKALLARQQEVQALIADRYGDHKPRSLRPTPARWRGYAVPSVPVEDVGQSHSHWSTDLIVLSIERGGRRQWPLESTLQLTHALRNCLMKASPLQPPPEWLSGHQDNGKPSDRATGHMAFVPLPHIGIQHADGHLLGLGVAVPRDITRGQLSECLNGLLFDDRGWPREITLTLGRLGECVLRLHEANDYRVSLAASTWTAVDLPSRRWATVTPIALDRHAKGDDRWEDIGIIIGESCKRIGLPQPLDVIPSAVSMFVGVPTTREMPRIERKKDNGRIRHVHAVLTFPVPVVGPVLLGAGRYRGYGFCRPLTERELP